MENAHYESPSPLAELAALSTSTGPLIPALATKKAFVDYILAVTESSLTTRCPLSLEALLVISSRGTLLRIAGTASITTELERRLAAAKKSRG